MSSCANLNIRPSRRTFLSGVGAAALFGLDSSLSGRVPGANWRADKLVHVDPVIRRFLSVRAVD